MYELIVHVDTGDGNIEEHKYECATREDADSMLKRLQTGAPIFAYAIAPITEGTRDEKQA